LNRIIGLKFQFKCRATSNIRIPAMLQSVVCMLLFVLKIKAFGGMLHE